MDAARSPPQGAHYHADVIYLFPKLGMKKGARALWCSKLSLHQLGTRSTVVMLQWTTHLCILYQVCATRGAFVVFASRWSARSFLTSRETQFNALIS